MRHHQNKRPFSDHGGFVNYSAGYVPGFESLSQIHYETFLAIQLTHERHRSPCENLAAEVFISGLKSLLYYRQFATIKGRRLYQEERAWLMSDDIRSPHAFLNLCSYFHLDADTIRRKVLALPAGAAREAS